MARRTSYNGQAYALQTLTIAPREDQTMLVYTTEELATGDVMVSREYRPNHVTNCSYHEAFIVGQRGKVKKLYSEYY